ncbi:hypothetical protein GWI33_021406 [Rhynchophorus ferrugineus]|uniref:Uncharacterized protein n=1 Tax=Rhynchophorus ferrugineus TaxID=354439 RepID=A0A834HUP5_RHYFE|nr:hypothetical protein GWI33_021407 [Rhynchophorus ferrugineus]KAF7265151.1 hypothetical protein GWI33_021406 [Rhynchophorus ferrugineus]
MRPVSNPPWDDAGPPARHPACARPSTLHPFIDHTEIPSNTVGAHAECHVRKHRHRRDLECLAEKFFVCSRAGYRRSIRNCAAPIQFLATTIRRRDPMQTT